jgi:hypothetical protein
VELLIIAGVDITHARLVDLVRLADRAKPFYDWVEVQFQGTIGKPISLNDLLLTSTPEEIHKALTQCYEAAESLPLLFDGVGRSYAHQKACYYFFSWLIRDAPQQRLGPLIQRIVKHTDKKRTEVEIDVLTRLICHYRAEVKTFSWEPVREVIVDRLEGSRRSIRGHEKEIVVRTALMTAIQTYFEQHKGYGLYSRVEIPDRQISINRESYDVSVNLLDNEERVQRRILIPIKTRETEGGGHSHLFSRDILSAIRTARTANPDDYIVVVIVAANWSPRETENLREFVDHLAVFEMSPGDFGGFDNRAQNDLNRFIESVFDGTVLPKPYR